MPRAMILAAGHGTRLRPLTLELPKPLMWVGDRPAIAHIAGHLVAAGITEMVVNTHHRADAFTGEMLARVPGRLTVVHEPSILGQGGGVANAAAELGEGDVLLWNGDILAPLDVTALLAAHRGAATLAIAPRARGQGTVGLGDDGRVVRLRGERFGEETASGDYLGIAVMGGEMRRALPIPGCLIDDGMLPWLRRGGRIGTFATGVEWDDIGSVEAYLRANQRWLSKEGLVFYGGAGVRIGANVDPTGSILGGASSVTGSGELTGCVVWPGAAAVAPLRDAVVTTGGMVVKAGG